MEMIKRRNETVYRDSIYVDGQRVRSPYFKRKADVKAWKAKYLLNRELAKVHGDDFKVPVKMTIGVFSKDWMEQKIKSQRTQSTYKNYERVFRLHINPLFGSTFLNDFTAQHADKMVHHLSESGHNAKGINIILQTLKAIFNDAEKSDLVRKNPLRGYRELKVTKLPPNFWSNMEIRQFLKACIGHDLYPLFVVALNTGMRKGELAGLCWDRVDFGRNMIEVSRIRDRYGLRATTKSGVARHVPMNDMVRMTLLRLFKDQKSDFVFCKKDGSPIEMQHLYRDFAKFQKKSGNLKQIRFHDLRHTFASHFMMNGGNLYDLQKVLGHSEYEMTQIYAHLSPEHLAKATQIVSFGREFFEEEKTSESKLVSL